MSIREWLRWPAVKASAAFLVVSGGVAGWSTVRAVRGEALPLAEPPAVAPVPQLAASALHRADIDGAVEHDLFAADRSPSKQPYRMPGESNERAPEQARPVVLGTAVSADGSSFATCQVGTEAPRIVRVGDRISGYTVKSIERGRVVFVSSVGNRLDIEAHRPQP